MTTDPSRKPTPGAGQEEAMPLPKFLMRIYYIFPIILYLPDMIFNFYVYSNGLLKTTAFPDVLLNPEFYLWAFLAAGIVGMAWLLSVLAPWHWARGNRFQSIMCWFGVVIATTITTWCSMSFRFDQHTTPFPTDQWFSQIFHIDLRGFSPTTVLVSVSPPFWGLFWAIVQPAERRKNAQEQAQDFELKKLRMQQEAELKKMRAEANAQVRGAQLAGLAASMKAARAQIGAAITSKDAPDAPTDATIIVEADAPPVPALPPAPADEPPNDTPEEDVGERDDAPPAEPVITIRQASATPRLTARAFKIKVRKEIGLIESHGQVASVASVAAAMNESEANVAPVFREIMSERSAQAISQ